MDACVKPFLFVVGLMVMSCAADAVAQEYEYRGRNYEYFKDHDDYDGDRDSDRRNDDDDLIRGGYDDDTPRDDFSDSSESRDIHGYEDPYENPFERPKSGGLFDEKSERREDRFRNEAPEPPHELGSNPWSRGKQKSMSDIQRDMMRTTD
jgi:hypothetical protein